jgi:hypothetical protein
MKVVDDPGLPANALQPKNYEQSEDQSDVINVQTWWMTE